MAIDDTEDNEDDLGRPGGTFRLDHGEAMRRRVLRFRFEAYGNRTIDHAQRDLILGSFTTDRRQWLYHHACASHPMWTRTDMDGHCGMEVVGVMRIRVIHLLHLNMVSRLLDELPPDVAGDEEIFPEAAIIRDPETIEAPFVPSSDPRDSVLRSRLERMLECPPNLALFVPRSRSQVGNTIRIPTCEQPYFCPFCLTRRATVVFKRLRRWLVRDRYYLLLAVNAIPSELPEEDDRDFARNVKRTLHSALTSLLPFRPTAMVASFGVGPARSIRFYWLRGIRRQTDYDALEFRAAVVVELDRGDHLFASGELEARMKQEAFRRLDSALPIQFETPRLIVGAHTSAARRLVFGGYGRREVRNATLPFRGLFRHSSFAITPAAQLRRAMGAMENVRQTEWTGNWRQVRHTARRVMAAAAVPNPTRTGAGLITEGVVENTRSVNRGTFSMARQVLQEFPELAELIRQRKIGRQRVREWLGQRMMNISGPFSRALISYCRSTSEIQSEEI